MIAVKCAQCKSKIFKYQKIGKGQLWHCWEDRITKDYSVRDGNEVKCQCGNLIGIVEGKWIKMKQEIGSSLPLTLTDIVLFFSYLIFNFSARLAGRTLVYKLTGQLN